MMDGSDIGGGSSTRLPTGGQEHQQLPDTASSGRDAYRYAFFGNEVLEEVDLGEMDEEDGDVEEFLYDKDESSSVDMMDGSDIGGGSSTRVPTGTQEHQQFPDTTSSGPAAFDASQYGNEALEEVKFGEMDEKEGDVPPGLEAGLEDEGFLYDKDESSSVDMMDGLDIGGGGSTRLPTGTQEHQQFPDTTSSGPSAFDLSQYGNEALEEVKLGEMDEKEGDVPPGLEAGLEDEGFLYDKDEAGVLRSLLDMDDLANAFYQLNKTFSGQIVLGERLSRESSSAAEWAQGDEPYWYERNELDFDSNPEGKQWSSHPYSSPSMPDSKSIFRTSSYSELQQSPKKMRAAEFFVPDEIVSNILTWLPVRSICRFKCVSKSWLSIISSPAFVDCHSARSKSRPGVLVTICTSKSEDGQEEESHYLFLADQVTEQKKGSALFLRQSVRMAVKYCPFPHVISPGDFQSVSGLMFGLCSQEMIRIANPSTNECVAFARAFPQSYSPSRHIETKQYIFLGFDPKGKHKFLEALSIFDRRDMEKRTEYRVVTVGDYANWRSIEDGPYIDRGQHRGQQWGQEICVEGVIYFTAQVTWPSGGIEEQELCMVAFDVKSESFQAVPLSFGGRRYCNCYYPWVYAEFEGKVAIVDYPFSNVECSEFDDMEHALELWVLEDFQTQDWRLKFSALPPLPMKMDNPYFPKHKLVGTTLDGKLIFVVFKGGDDFSYSSYNAMIQDVTDKGVPFSFLFFDMKTGDFWSSEVRLPDGFALTGQVRITAMGHVEKLLSVHK